MGSPSPPSRSAERTRVREALAAYSLMTVSELASFLNKSPESVRRLLRESRIPWVNVGVGRRSDPRVDPVDAAVFVLAEREGISAHEYWTKYGLKVCAERVGRYLTRIRAAQAPMVQTRDDEAASD